MRLAIYQGPSPKGAMGIALGTIDRMLTAAAAAGARMAVFPEVFLPGYNVADPAPCGAGHGRLGRFADAARAARGLRHSDRRGRARRGRRLQFCARDRGRGTVSCRIIARRNSTAPARTACIVRDRT